MEKEEMSENTARAYIVLMGLTITSFFEGIWNSVVDAIDNIFHRGILKISYGAAILYSLVSGIMLVASGALPMLGLSLFVIVNSVVIGTAITGLYFVYNASWNMVQRGYSWIKGLFSTSETTRTIFEEGGFGAYEVTRESRSTFNVAA